jgi:RNA polymerase sigma-70 factor, ECF subfamily
VPFSSLQDEQRPTVDPERFFPPDHSVAPGAWATPPVPLPEQVLLADETLQIVEATIETLPPAQRAVITLNDVEGWSADEIRNALELTETNRRVLLHRARAKVRRALEEYAAEAT